MKYHKGGWIKYSNRLLPRYEKESWSIEISKLKSIGFKNFENATIFQELINQRDALSKQEVVKK